jgi:hypothetical protein
MLTSRLLPLFALVSLLLSLADFANCQERVISPRRGRGSGSGR